MFETRMVGSSNTVRLTSFPALTTIYIQVPLSKSCALLLHWLVETHHSSVTILKDGPVAVFLYISHMLVSWLTFMPAICVCPPSQPCAWCFQLIKFWGVYISLPWSYWVNSGNVLHLNTVGKWLPICHYTFIYYILTCILINYNSQ